MLGKNPFEFTPASKKWFTGYSNEVTSVKNSIKKEGFTLIVGDTGYGKTSVLNYLHSELGGLYLPEASHEALHESVKHRMNVIEKWLSKPQPISKIRSEDLMFVDEVSVMEPRIEVLFKRLADRHTKILFALTQTELSMLRERFPTLIDRVTLNIQLLGLTKEDVKLLIQRRAGDAFEPEVIDYIAERYVKPRDVIRVCNDLWVKAQEKQMAKITKEMLEGRSIVQEAISDVKPEADLTNTQGKILDFLLTHPGSERKQIVDAGFSTSPNSTGNILMALMKRGLVERREGKYYRVSASQNSTQTEATREALDS